MAIDLSEFWTICSMNSIVLSVEQLETIERYARELVYWNQQVNLISRKDEDKIMEYHILHSLAILKYIEIPKKSRCLDIGTGGGFPGLPLTIANPDIKMLLTDSIAKKIKITSMLAKHTGIRHLEAKTMRVEDLMKQKDHIAHYDFIFARAVARIKMLMGWTYQLLKKDGKYVLLKGGDLSEEIDEAKKSFPNYEFNVIPIQMIGAEQFEQEEKKIVIIKLK